MAVDTTSPVEQVDLESQKPPPTERIMTTAIDPNGTSASPANPTAASRQVTDAGSAAAASDPDTIQVSKVSTVTIVPVQEGVKISEQTLVTPPRAKMRFYMIEPLLEKVFPTIRVLGGNAVDGFIFLKFAQLLIFIVGIITILCTCVLIPIHTYLDESQTSSVFVSASIASVPQGSRYFLAHFLVAFILLVVCYCYVRLLTSHAIKATKLSTVITDDKATIAARRTVHIRNMCLDYLSEEALKGEILRLLPPEKQSRGDIEILHVSLFHDVEPIVRVFAKKEKVLDEIERLEILAEQVTMNPTAKIKKASVLLSCLSK